MKKEKWIEMTKGDYEKLLDLYSKSHKLRVLRFNLSNPPMSIVYNTRDGYPIREEKFFKIKECPEGFEYFYNPYFVIYDRIKHE